MIMMDLSCGCILSGTRTLLWVGTVVVMSVFQLYYVGFLSYHLRGSVSDSQALQPEGYGNHHLAMRHLLMRGTRLLHTWTDDELFKRAIVLEEVKESHSQLSDSSALSNSTASDERGEKRHSKNPRACNFSGNVTGEKLAMECGLKIAYLFLARGEPPLAPLWSKYFQGHEKFYNIYLHIDPMNLTAVDRNAGVFWGRVVPSQKAGRGTPGLIAAARRLMANALIDDPRNEWFAIVSDSCIPLHSFQYTYKILSSTEKSFMGWTGPENTFNLRNRWLARGKDVMLPEIPYSDFRVASQFFIFRRRHALLVVRDTMYWSKFNHRCLDAGNCFPEEHYFPTMIAALDRNGTTMYSSTFVDWSMQSASCPDRVKGPGHPRQFCASDISVALIHDLQTRDDYSYLFARKFEPGALPNLLNIVDYILEH